MKADWDNIENNVELDVHVKRFKSKEVRIKKLQEAFLFPSADGSLSQEGHAQRKNLPPAETREIRRGQRTLYFGRGEE